MTLVGKFINEKAHAKRLSPRAWLEEQRAQASAPFELFVAVIIMSFVVIVGYQALEKVNTEVCLNTVDREMTKFKVSLEDTVVRKSQNKLFFSPDERCVSSKGTVMKIEFENDKAVCSARCNYPSDGCYVMTFSNPNIANAFKQKCLDLPPYTNFVNDCTPGVGYSDYMPINPMDEGQIKMGSYVFSNISPAGDTYPKICVFYKAGGS